MDRVLRTGTLRQSVQSAILIVEDDPSIREDLAWLLGRDGREVVAVPDGFEALERLRWGFRPALILLDMRMTVMTGWEFRAEQKKHPEFAQIPVVAMTSGHWKPGDLDDFTERLTKPLNMDDLRAVIDRYCGPPAEPPAVR
jgi:CheY-like chemotaxis protein